MIALCLFSCILFSTSLLCAVSPEENHWTLNVLTICKLCSSSALCVCAVHKYFFCKQAAYNYLKIVSSCAPLLPTWSELDCLILMHKTDCLVCVCADRNSLHITNEKVVFFFLTRTRQPSLCCHSGWTRNELTFNRVKLLEGIYYELFKHSIKDLMNWAACYWFFSAHLFHTDDFLVVFLPSFTPYWFFFSTVHFKIRQAAVEEDLTERCLCSPFLTPVQKPDLSRVIYSRCHRKRGVVSVTLFVASMNFTPL